MTEQNTILRDFIEYAQPGYEDVLKAMQKIEAGAKFHDLKTAWDKKLQKELKEVRQLAHDEFVEIFTMDKCAPDMVHDLKHGKEKGTTTYIEGLDNAWTWRMNEFNIWTGYSNEGKSLYLRFLCLIKAIMDGWKFAFYAPEDYPAKEFFDDLIHTASGYSTDKDNPNFIGEKVYKEMLHKLREHIYFVYVRPPKNSLTRVLQSFIPLIEEKGVKGCIIDPIIKVKRPLKYMTADDKYAAYVTTMATDFSRKFGISLNLVMHQLTPRLQENGLYPKPTMYNIKGGGTWTDGTDNILSIWRPAYARDKVDDEVMFTSHKIKKQKLVGIPQDVKFRFNRKTNRYVSYETKKDIFDFDRQLNVPRMKLLFDR